MSFTDVRTLQELEGAGEVVISWQAARLWNECNALVFNDSDALLLSRILRINQDAFIRFLALGADSVHPEALLQFLDLSPALYRVHLDSFDPSTLVLGAVRRERRQPTYAASRAGRIMRISFEALRDYASGDRNIHQVSPHLFANELRSYEGSFRAAGTPAPPLGALQSALSRESEPSALEETLHEIVEGNRVDQLMREAADAFPQVGRTMADLMERHQDVLVERFTDGDHRGDDFTELLGRV